MLTDTQEEYYNPPAHGRGLKMLRHCEIRLPNSLTQVNTDYGMMAINVVQRHKPKLISVVC